MCKRRDSIKAQNAAADALTAACTGRRTFRQTVNDTAAAPLPADFVELLGRIGRPPVTIPSVQPVVIEFKGRGKRHGQRH